MYDNINTYYSIALDKYLKQKFNQYIYLLLLDLFIIWRYILSVFYLLACSLYKFEYMIKLLNISQNIAGLGSPKSQIGVRALNLALVLD